ncbi:WD40 repeat-like protein [Zopfia rhizophila CBS 207.26]|uniref:WD40 repeat-like protein n=1 Tax=Zopfia rhizophila CBS 207.26 TaxID=1314779 RepID=A0A6A6DT72_9PEZI|nr:WD40 repeat-like protein [Zopfia rhizophila CBS 207.26]
MEVSDWRDMIDLTNDSDGDDGPLTALMAPPKTRQTPVPLPENVRHLYESSPSSFGIANPSPSCASPYPAPKAKNATLNGNRATTNGAGGRHIGTTEPNYVPVFSDARRGVVKDASSHEQAGKRRKLSKSEINKSEIPLLGIRKSEVPLPRARKSEVPLPGVVHGSSVKGKENGHSYTIGGGGFEAHRASGGIHQKSDSLRGISHSNGDTRLRNMNHVPTIRTLNEELNTKPKTSSTLGEDFNNASRALHIGRMSTDNGPAFGSYGTDSNLLRDPTIARSGVAREENTRMEYSSLGADGTASTQDAQMMLDTFKARANPIEKPTKVPDLSSGIHEGKLEKARQLSCAASAQALQEPKSASTFSTRVDLAQHTLSEIAGNLLDEPTPASQTEGRGMGVRYTTEDDHLLIFLKEVKKMRWKEITQYFPNRNPYTVQTRYSHYLNKRDRSQDPVRLKLPREFAAEARIDWATVHEEYPGPGEIVSLARESASLNRHIHHEDRSHPGLDSISNPLLRGNTSVYEHVYHTDRPRRSIQAVNYTWPRRNRALHPIEDPIDDESPHPQSASMSIQLRSTEASEEPLFPEPVAPVARPLEMDFEQEDSRIALSASKAPQDTLPYLEFLQRQSLRRGLQRGEWEQLSGRDWQGSVLHVDFQNEELEIIERTALKILNPVHAPQSNSRRKRLQRLLQNQPEHKLLKLLHEVRGRIKTRNHESIIAFVSDVKSGRVNAIPHIERVGAVRPTRKFTSNPRPSTSSVVRQRELSLQSRRGWKAASTPVSYQMKNSIYDTLGPAYSYTGASSDVHTVAWSPDGQCFAAGAVCVTDPDSMQYNRKNNLLYGDVTNKVIHELNEHSVDRERTASGPNSTHAMHASQDPILYTTVSMVQFSPDGQYMFSAGYDKHACIWQTKSDGSQPELLKALRHKAKVDLLTVSCTGLVATAAKKWTSNAVKVITINSPDDIQRASFTSQKAKERPDLNILPTALRFEPNYGRLLLGGFGANLREDRLDTSGDICLWDVETTQQLNVYGSTKNVFDVAFNPCQREAPLFAIGCVAGGNVNRGTRSTVRLYDSRSYGKYTMLMELECPALDMNDVAYCPYDENLIAAGCTDGSTYIWDIRRPNNIMYRLSHGKSLMPLDEYQHRESTDTGVRFLSWGNNATRLYTGSSDGVVKIWDVVSSANDVFIKDIVTLDSGIMSGAFSPDKSGLLLGEVNGSINVLEVGRDDCSSKDVEKLRYIPHELEVDADTQSVPQNPQSGVAIASELFSTGQIITKPIGGLPVRQALQGPGYSGPFDNNIDAPYLREQAFEFQLSLARTPGPQCSIPSCKDGIVKVTSEEIGDSGRSADRIPDELRKQWMMVGSELSVIPGKTKCTECGRPARPLESQAEVGESLLCERCSFTCFRCGTRNKIHPETEELHCEVCQRVWEIGALGYECVKDSSSTANVTDVPVLKRFGKGIMKANAKGNDDATFGDEMNALTDYYHSLAIDRPASPPL